MDLDNEYLINKEIRKRIRTETEYHLDVLQISKLNFFALNLTLTSSHVHYCPIHFMIRGTQTFNYVYSNLNDCTYSVMFVSLLVVDPFRITKS